MFTGQAIWNDTTNCRYTHASKQQSMYDATSHELQNIRVVLCLLVRSYTSLLGTYNHACWLSVTLYILSSTRLHSAHFILLLCIPIYARRNQISRGRFQNKLYPCNTHNCLTHWSRVTHICVGKPTIIGSDNDLSPGRRQAIIWTNVEIRLMGPLETSVKY